MDGIKLFDENNIPSSGIWVLSAYCKGFLLTMDTSHEMAIMCCKGFLVSMSHMRPKKKSHDN